MNNLFKIDESERKRILEMHENATRKNYLIYEEDETDYSYLVTSALGFGPGEVQSNGCTEIMLLDGSGYWNLICNICPNGYIDFKVEADYKNTTITGQWSMNGENINIKMSDGTSFAGNSEEGSLKSLVTAWLLKQKKYQDWVASQMDPDVKSTWQSWGGAPATQGQETPQGEEGTQTGDKEYGEYQGTSRKYTVNKNVIAFQKALDVIGYSTGKADGKFGPKTKGALEQFQNEYELSSSLGKMDDATRDKLVQVMKDEKPSESAQIQQELSALSI
jgi:hypothetical protein